MDGVVAVAWHPKRVYKRWMEDSIERLSFELAVGALREQERSLAGMRTTAATVIAAASVAVSLRDAPAGQAQLGAWGVLALVACASAVACGIRVLLPDRLTFVFHGEELRLAGGHERPLTIASAHRAAALWIDVQVHSNQRMLGRIALWVTLACLSLFVEVAALVFMAAW